MADDKTYTVDPNGTKTFNGPLENCKGNHNNMPKRDSSYLPTDERGHINASSLGGTNKRDNIAPQSYDLNHGSWREMEKAESAIIPNGSIQSEKIAYSSNQPGGRPDVFMANDTVTFASGNTQTVNLSFANMQNDQQAALNDELATETVDLMDQYANPGDSLRESMTADEYNALMEETDAYLPNIADMYEEWDYQGNPTTETETATADWDGTGAVSDATADVASDGVSTDADGAATDSDGGVSASDDDE